VAPKAFKPIPLANPAETQVVSDPLDYDRLRLLERAGITPVVMAHAVRRAWHTKARLLRANKAMGGRGDVQVPDNTVRLDAAVAIERMAGVLAPRADQTVIITHRVELPAWCQPDSQSRVIDVTERKQVEARE